MPEPETGERLASLLAALPIAAEPDRARALEERLPAPEAPRPITVTDLLAPRRALWRRLRGPAPIAADRAVRLELGRHWHRRLGDAVAAEGALEARVRRAGLVGRIDLLTDVPVEIKTASDAAPAEYPEQVEQLAVYCALVDRPTGRLVHVGLPAGAAPTLQVHDLTFGDLGALRALIARRAEELQIAFRAGSPAGLGRCHWFGRGCEYQTGGICDCRGEEPVAPAPLAEMVTRREARPDLAARWQGRLAQVSAEVAPDALRYRDLLYPRRSYFRQVVGGPAEAPPFRPATAPLDAYERAIAALESERPGALHRLPAGEGAPEDELLAWDGEPVLVRASRRHALIVPGDVAPHSPQYLLELGLRCAAAGLDHGRVVIALEHPPAGGSAVQVLRVDLTGARASFRRLADERRGLLARSVADRAPRALPACPSWMARDCPYRADCACAEDAGRSQR